MKKFTSPESVWIKKRPLTTNWERFRLAFKVEYLKHVDSLRSKSRINLEGMGTSVYEYRLGRLHDLMEREDERAIALEAGYTLMHIIDNKGRVPNNHDPVARAIARHVIRIANRALESDDIPQDDRQQVEQELRKAKSFFQF